MDQLFAVQAIMSLTDKLSGPLTGVNRTMAATEKRSAGLAARMQKLTKAMLPVAAAAGIFLAALAPCVGTAAGFEAALDGVGAVSRASQSEMMALETAALDLGASTAWSASQVADAEKYLAMAGYSVQENIAALPGVLNLASAAQEDLGSTANIASNVLSAFNLAADRTGEVADVLTATFTSSNTTLSGLASTMANAAPVASAAGSSLAEVAAMAGKLGDVGIDASRAGTGIKIMFQRLQGPTGAAAKTLESLGVITKDAAGNMRPIFDVLTDIQAATGAMGSADRALALKEIFGEEAVGSVTAIMNTGVDSVREYAATLNMPGAASEVAARQLDNLKGAVTILGSAWEGLKITIGKVFLPVLAPVIRVVSMVVSALNTLAQTAAGGFLIKLAGVVALAVVGFTAFTAASWGLSFALPFVTAGLSSVAAALAAVTWPVWLVAGAVVVLYRAWRTNFGGMADIVAGWWDKISLVAAGVRAVLSSLSGSTGTISGELAQKIEAGGLVGLVTTISRVVYRVTQFLKELWGSFSYVAGGVFDVFMPVIVDVAKAFAPLLSVIGYVGQALFGITASTDTSWWRVLAQVVGVTVGGAFKMLAWTIRGLITPWIWMIKLVGGLVAAFVWLGKAIGSTVGWIVTKIEGLVSIFEGFNLFSAGAKLILTFVRGIASVITRPGEMIKAGLTKVRNLLPFSDAKEGPLSALTLSGRRLMDTLGVGIQAAAPGLTRTVAGALAGVSAMVGVSAADAPNTPQADGVPLPVGPAVVDNRRSSSETKTVIIKGMTVELPNVQSGRDFVEELKMLVEAYDG
ncbi:MAG: phage tail tape measure protein [Thermodesulfobacteriota bacterium]|nr:phage tail tape measure protein [Thermodesulfobacteriota bacterium]